MGMEAMAGDAMNSGTQLVGQFGGMMLQNHYNKKAERRQDRYQRGLADYQVMKQDEMNENARKTNMKYWEDTNYNAQVKQMQKAGLNPGLMYEGGGPGGQGGNAGGSAGQGSVQTKAPDAQMAMVNAGMSIRSMLESEMMRAQIDNIKADTSNKEANTSNTDTDTEGKSINNKILELERQFNEETMLSRKDTLFQQSIEALGKARRAITDANVGENTQTDQIQQAKAKTAMSKEEVEQSKLRTIKMGVEIEAEKLGMKLTEAEISEVSTKIDKMTNEIANMKDMTAIQKENMLSQRMQVEFNTSTAAQIKQWTSVGKDVMEALGELKPGKVKVTDKDENWGEDWKGTRTTEYYK